MRDDSPGRGDSKQSLEPLRRAMYPRLYRKYANNIALDDTISKQIDVRIEKQPKV